MKCLLDDDTKDIPAWMCATFLISDPSSTKKRRGSTEEEEQHDDMEEDDTDEEVDVRPEYAAEEPETQDDGEAPKTLNPHGVLTWTPGCPWNYDPYANAPGKTFEEPALNSRVPAASGTRLAWFNRQLAAWLKGAAVQMALPRDRDSVLDLLNSHLGGNSAAFIHLGLASIPPPR